MSTPLFAHSRDLQRLRAEGYEVSIRNGHLVVDHVPFVTSTKAVMFGRLVTKLTVSATATLRPETHVAFLSGGVPCDDNGAVLTKIVIQTGRQDFGEGLSVDCTMSSKPASGYADYYELVTRYVGMLIGHAKAIDPTVTAQTFPTVHADPEESVFLYLDTASSKAGITAYSERFRNLKIAIIGLGGTGAYILDLVAKTPVEEIHLFDDDILKAHNAFRAPGAASGDELDETPAKVSYFQSIYARMHRGIITHPLRIDRDTAHQLQGLDFVFIAVDKGTSRRDIVTALELMRIPFIDVGMGIDRQNDALAGMLRVTTSTPEMRGPAHQPGRLPFGDGDDDLYASNIQVADMNSLNAALAVLRWKQHVGFYVQRDVSFYSTFTTATGQMLHADDTEHDDDTGQERQAS